jgi:hypothetical protein
MQGLHGCMGLTSGSARWLMSRATGHAEAASLRLSGKRRARPGHVPAPDPYSCWGPWDLAKARTLLGGTCGLPEGPGMPSWELRPRAYRGPVSLCGGPDPMMHHGVNCLSLPRGAPRPAHVVGSGAVLHVTWRCRTCAAPSYCRRGYP